ncbi:hypothetical protein PQ472_07905 [Lacticaseibacillus pabuli]|uniref:DNA-directed DNA polymerase n=1 Tax=Lacticaseibacillus pabuli TaxID=3025672 RepID=A0ABY7WS46_9LACO|nr:hypothetical protein [Lacticaseibacillus sp. KACC 23028]WDF81849.1 hypothetical protein PQ472_07905 [Lacticaseibacillus sp. KACC 23028]
MTKPILVYDIEVFAHDNIAVFKDLDGKTVGKFHSNGIERLPDGSFSNGYAEAVDLIKGKQLVGYNNHFYDDRILPKMLEGWNPEQIKALNDTIINSRDTTVGRETMLQGTYDCFQQIDVSRPGLKKIEANLGRMILESTVPFDINRKLTPEELEEVFYYCSYDVWNTVQVFKMRRDDYFEAKNELIGMMKRPAKKANDWNTTTISTGIILDKPLTRWSTPRVGALDADGNYQMLEAVPPEVKDLWMTKDKGHINIRAWDCDVQFGFGGIHGANTTRKVFKDVTMWDVTSMFPHIILNLNILGPASGTYKQIMDDRIRNKKVNPKLAAAQKIIINSVYGNLRSEYSMLYNPAAAKSVNFYSQSAIYQLCERLSPFVEHVQQNTDGIAFIKRPNATDTILEQIEKEWEQEFKLSLEHDHFTKLVQKDVNNYVGVHDDGSLKTKGGDVSRYKSDSAFRNNSTRIVDIAIVNKVIYGKDVVDTLMENMDKPHLFQFVIQAGRTYKGTFDDDGNKYQHINRVFAAKGKGIHLFKKRMDDGMVKFPNAPEEMLLYNDKLYDEQGNNMFTDFADKVDKNFYYKLILKTLERWEA